MRNVHLLGKESQRNVGTEVGFRFGHVSGCRVANLLHLLVAHRRNGRRFGFIRHRLLRNHFHRFRHLLDYRHHRMGNGVIDQIEHCHHVQDLDEPGIGARPDGIAHHHHDKQTGKEVFEDNNPFLLHPLGIRSRIVDELLLAMQKPEDDGEVTHHLQENDRSIDIA